MQINNYFLIGISIFTFNDDFFFEFLIQGINNFSYFPNQQSH